MSADSHHPLFDRQASLMPINECKQTSSFDVVLLFLFSALLAIGMVMMASVSMTIDSHDLFSSYLFNQFIHMILGLCGAAAMFCVPLGIWKHCSGYLIVGVLILLIFVLVPGIGHTVNNSARWIPIGGINVQPSELAKFALIAWTSSYFAARSDISGGFKIYIPPMLMILAFAILLRMEPDLGTLVVFSIWMLGMFFLAGLHLKFIAYASLALCVLSVFYIYALSSPYQLERVMTFMNPAESKYGDGYQLVQSWVAFDRGGWLGLGIGNSVQKLAYLPEAHNDFVFAIWGEETGALGSVLLVLLFSSLGVHVLCIGTAAKKRGDLFSAFFSWGAGLMITMQAFISMGVNMALLPTKGLNLPLISYGGSNLIIYCLIFGVIFRVAWENRRKEPRYGAKRRHPSLDAAPHELRDKP
ncbi:MAG: putative lipid II flippase FtsW [Candidatus Eutrophobiaceae bacterium]